MVTRRYEGAPAPVTRKLPVRKVVARKPPTRRPSRRYEGAGPLPKAPVKRPVKAPIGRTIAMRPPVRRYEAGPTPRKLAPPVAAGDARRAGSPGTPWSTGKMFVPSVRLDPSQVEDYRNVHRGRVRARHIYNRDFRGRVEGVIPNRPTTPARRIGRPRAI